MRDRGILSSYLLSTLFKNTKPEHASQVKLVKESSSNRVNDLLIDKTTPFTLYKNLLTFRGTDIEFESQGELLKTMTNRNYNMDFASSHDRNFL